jgi:hypothetical protein
MTGSNPRLDIEITVLKFIRRARAKTDADIAGIEGLATTIGNDYPTGPDAAREMSKYLLAAVRMAALFAEKIEMSYTPLTSGSDLLTDLEHVIREDNR